MDTPERNQIGTPKAKFEDSPVFNYINSLSPIKPVKSVHITQTFSSLSFASLPSVFTSPHVSSHKESRFLRRHNPSDPSKSESSLESGNKVSTNEDAAELCINSAELQEDCVPGDSIGEASVEPRNEHSKFVIELPRNLKYDCGSPESGATTRCGTEAGCESEVADLSAPLVPYVQKTSENGSSDDGAHLQNICQSEQRNELTGCDWESLISGASDLLIFDSPNGSEPFRGIMQNPLDSVTRFCNSLMPRLSQNETADEQNVLVLDTIVSGEQPETEDPSSQYGEASQPEDTELMQDHLNSCMVSSQIEKEDSTVEAPMQFSCKPGLNLHRGLRRRCLDFEMVGARRKSLDNVPNSSSSMLSQSDEKITTNDKQLVPMKPGGESSRCILPGIGLHLNALATTSKDYKTIKHENMAYGRQLSLPNLTAPANSPTAGQGPGHESFSSASSERDMDGTDNGVQLLQDASQEPAFLANEEFNQNSPKKKRPKFEQAGETESSCKRCNCKKSKCLKLYCECFAAGVYCIEPCSCQECFNKPIHEDTVLATRKQIESRNPLAFAPKVIRNADPVPEYGEESSKTPASARHKRGCNCKKSSCLKKYCECYQGGVGCSISCRCEGCKNTFGRKDGSFMGTETEADEEEAESCGKSVAENRQQKNEIQENEEQHQDSALPTTPLRLSRQLVSLPFSSKNKPPRSSVFSIGSSSGLYTSQKLGILCPETKFERHIQAVPEDEMPEILQGDGSPSTGIKTASPNGKRVCPPNREFAPSPGRRAGRKLILQSIPSFPSLTPQN